jgi:hypothetical protein
MGKVMLTPFGVGAVVGYKGGYAQVYVWNGAMGNFKEMHVEPSKLMQPRDMAAVDQFNKRVADGVNSKNWMALAIKNAGGL